jgi:hypothetical protein
MTTVTKQTKTNRTFAQDMAEMMQGWNKIEAAAKKQFPNATKEELFQICKSAMNHALGR